MAEDPKRFLREIKAGIGDVKVADLAQRIDFEDASDAVCRVESANTERLYLISTGGRIVLSPGQAKRLANTLERWAIAGNLGI